MIFDSLRAAWLRQVERRPTLQVTPQTAATLPGLAFTGLDRGAD
jgi:hypothetical protein